MLHDCHSDAHSGCGRLDQDGAKVVDVGERRAGDELIAQGLEEAVPVIVGEAGPRLDPRAIARARVSGVTMAPAALSAPSIPSVSPASAQTPGCPPATARASRNSTLRPTSLAFKDGRLAAGKQDAWGWQRMAVQRHRAGDPGHDLADLGGLALERVAQQQGRDADSFGDGTPPRATVAVSRSSRSRPGQPCITGLGVSSRASAKWRRTASGGTMR